MAAKSRDWTQKGPVNRYGGYGMSFRKEIRYNTQPEPYTKPLAYRMGMCEITAQDNSSENVTDALAVYVTPLDYPTQRQQAYNKAYEKWADELRGSAAEMLTAWVERRKTFSMFTNRLIRLTSGLIAAKRGDVRTLKRLWGKGAGVRQKLRDSGSHVLEYSFGWAPLVSDAANVLATFRNGVPASRVKGRKAVKFGYSVPPKNAGYKGRRTFDAFISFELGATVAISDPNVALANQLGLLNPVATLWELTPWSFVVDYFVNAQSFIGSFTDRLGFDIQNEYATCLMVTNTSVLEIPPDPAAYGYRLSYSGKSCVVERATVISRPALRGRPPWDLSPARALTSVALLLQQLKGK